MTPESSHAEAMCKASTEEVIRHFLRLEASRNKYQEREEEIVFWCSLPDEQMCERVRRFADERDDTNPVLVYTVGDRSKGIAKWTRERIKCADIYTRGIAPCMHEDLAAVAGNVRRFALEKSTKFPEFVDGRLPQEAVAIIVIKQTKPERGGAFELLDGAHRLVAFCRAGVETVEAFIGYPKSDG